MAIYKKLHKRSGIEFYYVRFGLPDGKRKVEKAGTTRDQARRLLRKRLGEVVSGTYRDPLTVANPPFGVFADRFMREHGEPHGPQHYAMALKSAREHFGDRGLRDITRNDIEHFGRVRGEQVGPSTVRKNLTAVGTLFRCAVRWGVLDANPAADVEKPREPRHRTRYLSREEYQRLRAAAPPWLRQFYRLAAVTGFRLKELVGLTWDLVDREAGLLHVSEDNKTGLPRSVPLGTVAREVLAGQARRLRSPWVFLDAAGEPYVSKLARQRIVQATIRLMRRQEIQEASFHTLRHTAASWAAQAGVSPVLIAEFLGHASRTMTDRYMHLQPDHLRPLVAALDMAESTLATPSATQTEDGRQTASTPAI